MLLGFRDRWGDQIGDDNLSPTLINGTERNRYRANTGGDLLRASLDNGTGDWTIEPHVTPDGIAAGSSQDSEFFNNEFLEEGAGYSDAETNNEFHQETAKEAPP